MKELIVQIGLIALGVWLALSLILGSGSTSMKTGATNVGNKMSTDITSFTSDTTTP
ncbi:MAG: hypothetical protein Q8934_08940 [Bacillota bacterium]|nr:hypothetical protein [Bacillota bacterium]